MPGVRYPDAVREEAIRLVMELGKPVSQVAQETGCYASTIHQWLKPYHRKANAALAAAQNSSSTDTLPQPQNSLSSSQNANRVVAKTSKKHERNAGKATFIPIQLAEATHATVDKNATLELTTQSGTHLRLTGVSSDFVIEILKTLS